MPLTSPVTYGCGQYSDVIESIEYIYQEYCSEIDRKIFALGFSLGGNWLGMGLAKHKYGLKNRVTAAALWQSPTIFAKASENLKTALWGMIDKSVGKKLKAGFVQNVKYLSPTFEQNHNVNL